MGTATSVRKWLQARRREYVDLLERLVSIPSHAADPEGVSRVAALVTDRLTHLGFAFSEFTPQAIPERLGWLEQLMSPGVPYTQLGSSYSGFRAGRRPGRLLIVGDLDTAFPAGSVPGFGFSVDGPRAFGPGIADMKGGLVVMVAALEGLRHLGVETPDIAVTLSGDEQAGSLASRPMVESAATGADWCLGMECARRGGKVMAARGHIGVGRIEITGRESHTGSAHAEGINALEALAWLIVAYNGLTNEDDGTYITVTMAEAGRRRSVTPASASAVVDIRTRGPEFWKSVVKRMNDLARSVARDSGASVKLHTHNHRPGVDWDEGAERLLSLAREVGGELSIHIDAFRSPAAGSVSFRSPPTATLDGLGPVGGGLMTRGEYIEVESLVTRAALLAGMVARLKPR